MQPLERELFQNGEVTLEVHKFDEGWETYWIRGGVGYLEFEGSDFIDLIDLLRAYDDEVLRRKRISFPIKLSGGAVAFLGLFVTLLTLIGKGL